MFALIVLIIAILATAFAQELPTLPSQYMVTDINLVMDTNAGYPPHYTETDTAQYFDYELKMTRTDVEKASYGQKGSYSIIHNYVETFPINCGPQYPNMMASRGYLIASGQCCWSPLVSDCPAVGPQAPMPSADTMYNPALPKKIAYMGTSNLESGSTANWWQSLIYAGQPDPVMQQDFYFDTTSGNQLVDDLFVVLGPQFINATTTYDGQWSFGSQAPELFDISAYDCTKQCSSSVTQNVRNAGINHRNHA